MESIEVREKVKFTGIEKSVIVKPIKRLRGGLVDDVNHEAAFLFGTSGIDYKLPFDLQGNLINPFSSKEEQEWLEKELDLDLNFHKIKDNFWKTHKVTLKKDDVKLNLKNPKHYLDYILLKANKLFIASSLEEQFDKVTYRYVFMDEADEVKQVVKKADLEMEAYMALGVLRNSKEDMLNFLSIYGKKVSKESKIDFLFMEIKKIVESDLENFLNIIRDKGNYEVKLLIANCVEAGILTKKNRQYFQIGGDPLCEVGQTSTLEYAIKYLKEPINEELLLNLKTRLENTKE